MDFSNDKHEFTVTSTALGHQFPTGYVGAQHWSAQNWKDSEELGWGAEIHILVPLAFASCIDSGGTCGICSECLRANKQP